MAESEAAVFSQLVDFATDAEPTVRQAVAEALGHFRGGRPEAIPALTRLLLDAEPSVRIQAARSIAEIGPVPAQAMTALVELLADQNVSVAREAARALGKVGGARFEPAIHALAHALKTSTDFGLREEAAHALSDAGHSPGALSALTAALSDPNTAVRREVLHALGRMPASHADHVVPTLNRALDDSDEAVRAAATQAAGSFGVAALPVLVRALQDPAWLVRWWATLQLGHLGSAAAPAIEGLRRILQDEQEAVREAAANALARIQGTSSPSPYPAIRPSASPIARH